MRLLFTAVCCSLLCAACTGNTSAPTPAAPPAAAPATPQAAAPAAAPATEPAAAPAAGQEAVVDFMVVNAGSPGLPLDLAAHAVPGQITVFDMYSDYCPPCRALSPLLERMAVSRPDVVVRKVDINRKGVQGIDWQSPLARQYNLSSIPAIIVYDAQGNLMETGLNGFQLAEQWTR